MILIEKIKRGLKKRKVKLFLVFLLCSFCAWFISNLSESYTSNATFNLKFVGIPEDKMLMESSLKKLDVKLEAVGFQFLRFNFKNKTVAIDVSSIEAVNGRYFVVKNQYRKQIDKQLSNSMRLLEMTNDTIFLDFQNMVTKEIPVAPLVEMNFAQNYVLDGMVTVTPSVISITGPVGEVSDLRVLETPEIELNDLTSDFSKTVSVIKPDSLFHSSFSAERVTISGTVVRFSEKIIEVPIEVLNLPNDMAIQTFPDKAKVLCKAKVSDLKKLKGADFKVAADFNEISSKERILVLSVRQKPKGVFSASLTQNKVEYILKQK